jgi:hypothetical protein
MSWFCDRVEGLSVLEFPRKYKGRLEGTQPTPKGDRPS